MKEKKPHHVVKSNKHKPLKEEDMAIWGQATEDVAKFAAPNIITDDTPKRLKRHYKQTIGQNINGTITLETFGAATPAKKTIDQPSSFQVDANLKKRFEKGDLPIEGKIDLHGLTLAQAHHRFTQFMMTKIKEGARFILVVTGKGSGGKESGDGTGVIRQNFPLWCEDKNLKPYILQCTIAQPKHGGSGARYILLRRQK